jgi:hypothetical protein
VGLNALNSLILTNGYPNNNNKNNNNNNNKVKSKPFELADKNLVQCLIILLYVHLLIPVLYWLHVLVKVICKNYELWNDLKAKSLIISEMRCK